MSRRALIDLPAVGNTLFPVLALVLCSLTSGAVVAQDRFNGDSRESHEGRSIQVIATGVADFAGNTLENTFWTQVMDIADLRTRMASTMRAARATAAHHGEDADIAAKATVVIVALEDIANAVARAPRSGNVGTARALARFEADLRGIAAVLSAAVLPLPSVRSISVSTPRRRAVIEVLDVVQSARADQSFIQPRRHISLVAALDTVERAAQSVLLGEDKDENAVARVAALAMAMLMSDRVATNIGNRTNENMEMRSKSLALSASLRALVGQFGAVPPSSLQQARNATQWLWWDEPVQQGE
jgi:hypothetical protein